MVENLKSALEEVNRIANKQARRNMVTRVVFNMTDAGQIRQIRDMIITAVLNFEVLSHIKMNELLLEVAVKQQELSQGMKNLSGIPQVPVEEKNEEKFSHCHVVRTRPGVTKPPGPAFVGSDPNTAFFFFFLNIH